MAPSQDSDLVMLYTAIKVMGAKPKMAEVASTLGIPHSTLYNTLNRQDTSC